jgi:hypothetical protein
MNPDIFHTPYLILVDNSHPVFGQGMIDFLTSATLKDLLTRLATGNLNLLTAGVWLVIAAILSMIGGAIGGMLLAGRDLGFKFSATLGALFGPGGAIPTILLGLLILNVLSSL